MKAVLHSMAGSRLTTLGFCCGSNMPTGSCEVQADQPSDPPDYPVRFKPLLERGRCAGSFRDPAGSLERPSAERRQPAPFELRDCCTVNPLQLLFVHAPLR